jgi:hypothetical protein
MAFDPTENLRRSMVAEINSNPSLKSALESDYGVGNVWTTAELSERFEVIGFMAPFAVVREKATGKKGTVMFQHSPRLYFNFEVDGE